MTRDLNVVIATGNNWKLPVAWGPIVRYISAPILSIIISFAYPSFYEKRNDPLHIFAFSIAHIAMILPIVGFIVPRMFNVFVSPAVRAAAEKDYIPGVVFEHLSPDAEAIEKAEEPEHEHYLPQEFEQDTKAR